MSVGRLFRAVWPPLLFGIVFLSHQVGSFLGVWLGGRIYDMTQSYAAMWWISIALGLLSALLNWPIEEKPVRGTPPPRSFNTPASDQSAS